MRELADESTIFSVPIPSSNPTHALNHGQTGSNFHARNFGDQDDIIVLVCFWFPLFNQMTHPSAARFGDIVFNQSASIEVVESHAQRRFSIMIWLRGGSRTRLCMRRMWSCFPSSGKASHSAARRRSSGVGSRTSPSALSQARICAKSGGFPGTGDADSFFPGIVICLTLPGYYSHGLCERASHQEGENGSGCRSIGCGKQSNA